MFELCTLAYCCNQTSFLTAEVLFFLNYQLHAFDILSAWTVLFLKSKDDVLIGYSRLEDLIKVSIF